MPVVITSVIMVNRVNAGSSCTVPCSCVSVAVELLDSVALDSAAFLTITFWLTFSFVLESRKIDFNLDSRP